MPEVLELFTKFLSGLRHVEVTVFAECEGLAVPLFGDYGVANEDWYNNFWKELFIHVKLFFKHYKGGAEGKEDLLTSLISTIMYVVIKIPFGIIFPVYKFMFLPAFAESL